MRFLSRPSVFDRKPLSLKILSFHTCQLRDLRDLRKELAWEPRWLDPITGGAGVLRTFLCVPVEPRSTILSSLLALHPLSLTFPLFVHGSSTQDPPMLCTSLRVSWQVYTRIFLLPSPPRPSVTTATLVRVSLYPPAPKGN